MPRVGLDQNKILQVAVHIANEQGLNQVTIAALAKKLHVKSPSLYNHFRNLTEIQTAIAQEGIQKLEETLFRSLAGISGDEALLTFAKQYLAFAIENPGLYEATVQPMRTKDPLIEKISQNIIDLLVKLLADFHLEEQHALHVVRGLRSVVHGFASLQRAGGFQMDFQVEDSLRYTIQLLCSGLKREHQENGAKQHDHN
jgi:AcrR family transcriptional regulator